jgi:hypothetical protein
MSTFGGPLVLVANLAIGPSAASAFDVSDQVTEVQFQATRAMTTVPPTGTTDEGVVAGAVQWSCRIGHLANDVGAQALTRVLYDALIDTDGELWVEGTMRGDPVGVNNPLWGGTIVVGGLGMGGTQRGLAQDVQTHRMKAAPSIVTSAASFGGSGGLD